MLITWMRERAHRTCTELITRQHDALVEHAQARYEAVNHRNRLASEGYRLEEALSESAEAHHAAEEALGEARTEIERLTGELAAARADADQANAARRAMVQALAAVLGGDDDAERRVENLREQRDLDGLMDRFLEVWAIRSGLEHLVRCSDADLGEHLHAAVLRLLERTDERSHQVRELDAATAAT